jgi:N-sulfoglucosamine sulfohydrolase
MIPFQPVLFLIVTTFCAELPARAAERPNILWITAEDMSPHLGCYGDTYARTPHLDAFARESVRYTHAFATAPVCSPARACLITGVYATSLGNPHLRCEITIPQSFRGFPAYLREAGYYTTNNVKTDYNLQDEAAFVKDAWDRSADDAHWRGRKPGQPFFAVINLMTTHQSRTSVWPTGEFEREVGSRLPPGDRADRNRVPLPPIWPDSVLARRAMARYYDCVQAMDAEVGSILQELERDGLADDTIVFFYSDHGMGMPGGKRRLHDSGMHVPLLVRLPEKWRHLAPAAAGSTNDRLVSFVDFPPTVLSLARVEIPEHMQGTAFLGPAAGESRRMHVYGARDRVDEAFDTARSVRDHRWLYIRNYRPHLSWAQPEGYSDQSEFRRELVRLAREGALGAGPMTYLAPTRPPEELYDTQTDPHQLYNLAALPENHAVLLRMRTLLRDWIVETRDLGFLPEADMLARAGNQPPYAMARQVGAYPIERILDAAELVGQPDAILQQKKLLADSDPGIRYWAAVGLHAMGDDAGTVKGDLAVAARDRSSAVRIEAAGALAALEDREGLDVLTTELGSLDWNAALHAARTLQLLGDRAEHAHQRMRSRLETARQQEGDHSHALFIRFALEGALKAGS